MIVLKAKLDGDETVFALITDLTSFVHAEPNAEICIYDAENNPRLCLKRQLQDLELDPT